MNYRDARQLVRDDMEITHLRQRKPDTFVEIRATVHGRTYKEWGRMKPAIKAVEALARLLPQTNQCSSAEICEYRVEP